MTVLYRGKCPIYYKLEPAQNGKAAPLVFLHGNMMTHACFDLIVPLLNDRFPIMRCDLRGFGQSEAGNEPLSMEMYLEDLRHLVQSVNLRPFHLIGYGFGAIVAVKFAVQYPELVKSIVLLSMPFSPATLTKKASTDLNALPSTGAARSDDSITRFIATLPPNHPARAKIDYAALPATHNWITLICIDYQPVEDLSRLTVPTLLLCGEEENSSPVYLSLMAAYYLSEYKLYTIPDSASMVVIDQPELTASCIASFIDKLDQGGAQDGKSSYTDTQSYMKQLVHAGEQTARAKGQLRVELLHSFRVYANGVEVKGGWNQRFAKNIFLYLLLHRSAGREQLCETLWPDLPLSKARNYLRVYLSHLKKMLEPIGQANLFLILEREDIYLWGNVICDALDFLQDVTIAAQETDDRKKLALCKSIVQSLPATFFQSLYDDWFISLRDQWEHSLVSLVLWMADYCLLRGNPLEASTYVQQLLRLLPKHEALIDKLIDCYERSKDTTSKQYWTKQKDLEYCCMD